MRIYACIATALVLYCQGAAAIDDTPAQFTLRESEARAGSHLRRDAGAVAAIVSGKRYAELGGEEKRALRAAYDSLGADDEPPFPLNGMARIQKSIREVQARSAEKGLLRMAVKVDSKGDASAVEILSSPGEKTSKFAALVLMAEKYKPALCRGLPCGMEFPYSAEFAAPN